MLLILFSHLLLRSMTSEVYTLLLCSSEIQANYNCFTCTPVSHNLQNIQDDVIRVMDILESLGLCAFANKQRKQ